MKYSLHLRTASPKYLHKADEIMTFRRFAVALHALRTLRLAAKGDAAGKKRAAIVPKRQCSGGFVDDDLHRRCLPFPVKHVNVV